MPKTTPQEFQTLLQQAEGVDLEVKLAARSFSYDKLAQYCVSISNDSEHGGHILLGVSDDRPRQVKGTSAFTEPGKTEADLIRDIGADIRVEEYDHEGKRVLIVHVPPLGRGQVVSYGGTFYSRSGETLTGMTGEAIRKKVRAGDEYDYSAEPSEAGFADLDMDCVADFIDRCRKRKRKASTGGQSPEDFLRQRRLLIGKQATYAALVLLGTEAAVRTHLPYAEVSLRVVNGQGKKTAWKRTDYVRGFFGFHDDLWELINQRNNEQRYQDRFFMPSVPTFDEASVREAVINAVTHREYRDRGIVLITQAEDAIEFSNPGGFLEGVSPDSISSEPRSRNKLIAEAFQWAGLVERAGEGVPLMISTAIEQGKPLPDYSTSDEYNVRLSLDGRVVDSDLLLFIERMADDSDRRFSYEDYLVLSAISKGEAITDDNLKRVRKELLNLKLITSQGTGRATKYYLAGNTPAPLSKISAASKEAVNAGVLPTIALSEDKGVSLAMLENIIQAISGEQIQQMIDALENDGLVCSNEDNQGEKHWRATPAGVDFLNHTH